MDSTRFSIHPYNGSSAKLYLTFPGNVTCSQYKIIITENHSSGWPYSNIAETGALTASVADNTSWDRTNWVITASDNYPGQDPALIKDGNNGTWWEAN